jgi:sialidase-1
MKKINDVIVFRDTGSYSAFTCAERCVNGDILIAFRCAPREPEIYHFHSQSKAVVVRSSDEGKSWSEPIEIFPDYDLAQQDPQITLLPDGRLLAAAFTWQFHPKCERSTMSDAFMELPEIKDGIMRCAGIILAESSDNGYRWKFLGKMHLDNAPRDVWACAAMHSKFVVLPDGGILIPCRVEDGNGYYTYLVRSDDGGRSWRYVVEIVRDTSPNHHVYYDEAYLQRLSNGRLVLLLRSYGDGGLMECCFSDDDGRSWSTPVKTEVWGFPQTSTYLSDGRLLLSYGYRREPYGVRARIVSENFSDVDNAEETVVYGVSADRAQLVNAPYDLGYPSAVELKDKNILIAYYCYDLNDRTSYIRGTFFKK